MDKKSNSKIPGNLFRKIFKKRKINAFVLSVSLIVLAYYTLVSIWPFIYNTYLSLFRADLMTKMEFVGFKNYLYLFKNPVFWTSLWHNLFYLVILISVGLFSSIIIAALIYRTSGAAKKIYISAFFCPVVTSLVTVSIIWKLLYFPNSGIFAQVFSSIFHIKAPLFLSDPKIALLCIIIMDIWKDTGLRTIVLLSGMEEIPETFYEAARIDGASSIWQFLKITIPLLRPQIIFLSAVYSINAIRTFSQVYMMTGNPPGGPANSTKVLVVQMYQEAFYSTKFGTGAAISMIIFLFLFGLVILEIKAFSQKSDY